MKTCFITGVTGQDGAHIAQQLVEDGWKVYGGRRRGSSSSTWRLDYLGITDKIELVECQLTEPQNMIELLQNIKPDHIFHYAGESFVADSFKYPGVTLDVNAHGTLNLLEAARLVSPKSKIFCASSSEIFGNSRSGGMCNETSEQRPANPYGISKLTALHYARLYRERHGAFVCSAVMFNHEGPLRGGPFVTRKITHNIARLKVKGGDCFELGNLDSARDWGAAEDYVAAGRLILDLNEPSDYVIASGKAHTVRDFLGLAATAAGFDPVFEGQGIEEVCIDRSSGKVLTKVSSKYFRPQDTPAIVGDASKLIQDSGWAGTRNLSELVSEMVDSDIRRWERGIVNI
jgi:GDPmannose 4,6-dehydratase